MGQHGMVNAAIQVGTKDFIVKPFSTQRVQETVGKIFIN